MKLISATERPLAQLPNKKSAGEMSGEREARQQPASGRAPKKANEPGRRGMRHRTTSQATRATGVRVESPRRFACKATAVPSGSGLRVLANA